MPEGIFPVQAIRALVSAGGLKASEAFGPGQIQPASVDLRLGPRAYRVRASFLPGPGGTVAERLADLKLHEFDIAGGAVLETGCVYVVPLLESLALPDAIAASANPKSSTGRLDVFTRVIADGVSAFDLIPAGYKGPLYAEICPQTFPIVVRKGSKLSQLRFRHGDPRETDDGLVRLQAAETLVSGATADIRDGIALSVDLAGDASGLVGYRAKKHTGVVDVDAPGACAVADYWEPVRADSKRRLILDPDQFYILASKEAVHIPPTHAAEMMPFNPLVGEFRVHYAGFMDPGFGHSAAGGSGSRVVLEVRSHTVPFILEDGQIVGRLVYERMMEVPEVLYGRELGSNYQAQGLKLSKHFK
ncbi:2'-deoxycytidine 5'-triphosphate deaminase [Hyphomicrobium sp. LHD-15]|uniref:2'-deoxycytidine 5'-triphosphate deaminase n=1 Tax=Hyphomicrobium sp. LHD-15 TaxID=3072142 RepID=UPI00280DDB96|nr:2'-deoxycytidine 5'-triphosphate deaminase [Hyphomicrobium sp. LHD-15]MDQ8698645.1 2'-deoxycytidine 5'-triphosphate deaminase [Hyphomicrobium sp. LHD-15]